VTIEETVMAYGDGPRGFEEIDRLTREWEARAVRAQAAAAHAYSRLLSFAEDKESGQARTVAAFLAATYNGASYPMDPSDLRAVDVDISDDMLCCLDALRWGKADLFKLVPDGDRRIAAMCKAWGLEPRNSG
jgi:hypothetical protein